MNKKYPKIDGNELKETTKLRFDEIEKVIIEYNNIAKENNIKTNAYNLAFLILTDPNIIFFNMIDSRSVEQLEKILKLDNYFADGDISNPKDYKVRKEYTAIVYNRKKGK